MIPGDFPDPSIIRDGNDYYATATSGGWSPFFPIAHSRDLTNWKIVGSVFKQMPAWAKGDFWAPELTKDNGKFYVFYTARRDDGKGKKGTLCVAVASAEQATGPYTDRGPLVCQEMGSLDPFFIRDEDGKPYLIWKEDGNDRQQPTWLYAQQMDAGLTKLVGSPKKLFRNEGSGWENHVIEGADVIRQDGWYYLFYSGNACCGRTCNYALGVARSKTLLGKWEKNPANPILPANELWQCPGHGTIVRTPDGSDYLMYHAYRKGSEAFNIGREALLDRVSWTSDGWATINDGRCPSGRSAVSFGSTPQIKDRNFIDDFHSVFLDPGYETPRAPLDWVDLRDGSLAFANADNGEAVLAARSLSGNYVASVTLKNLDRSMDETVGLSGFGWRENAVGISVGAGRVSAWRRENGKSTVAAEADVETTKVIHLRMSVTEGEIYQFAYSLDEKVWIYLGKPITGNHVEGARIALLHAGKGRNARFDDFKMRVN